MGTMVRRGFDLQDVSDDRLQDFLDAGYHVDGEDPVANAEETPTEDAAKEA